MLVNISDAFPLDTLISRPQILKNLHDIYPETYRKGAAALMDHVSDDLQARSRPSSGFARTSFSAAFSKPRSAYIRLRRSFACASSVRRFISEAASPPYVAFYL